MPKVSQLVINTSPLIALVAALGNLEPLGELYERILVPWEVSQEITKGGLSNFAIAEFVAATHLTKLSEPLTISPFLSNFLDLGEASVIQLALDENIKLVCIDEVIGRRVARLNDLHLTGSLGILLRWKQRHPSFSIQEAIKRMTERKIRLSQRMINNVLKQAQEFD